MSDKVVQIYSVLSKNRYNRATPNRPDAIKLILQDAVEKGRPVPFIGYWDCAAHQAGKTEHNTCRFLTQITDAVKKVYPPGMQMTFLLALAHSLMNGYDETALGDYQASMKNISKAYGFETLELTPFWDKHGISMGSIQSDVDARPPGWWNQVHDRKEIEERTSRRALIGQVLQTAQRYYVRNQMENRMLAEEFPDHIFSTFSRPGSSTLPDVPTFYFYSTGRGKSQAPWDMNPAQASVNKKIPPEKILIEPAKASKETGQAFADLARKSKAVWYTPAQMVYMWDQFAWDQKTVSLS